MSQAIGTTLSLEQRLARMEAIQEIKFRYTEGTDFGYDLDKIASCFTEDRRWFSSTSGAPARCHGQTIPVSRTPSP
jgi:hypothetical protein